jgi:hypothetical protein
MHKMETLVGELTRGALSDVGDGESNIDLKKGQYRLA